MSKSEPIKPLFIIPAKANDIGKYIIQFNSKMPLRIMRYILEIIQYHFDKKQNDMSTVFQTYF